MHTSIVSPIVLMYHGIVSDSTQSPAGRETGAELYDVGNKDFTAQMEFLKDSRFSVVVWGSIDVRKSNRTSSDVNTATAPSSYEKRKGSITNAVVCSAPVVFKDRKVIITFDDGEVNNFSYAYPVLKEYGFPAYFFITTGRIGKPGYLDWEHLIKLHSQGMTIGSHGLTHEILTEMTDKNLLHELTESKRILEAGLENRIFSLSIPRGFYNNRVLKAAAEAGYKEIYVSGYPRISSDSCIGRVAVKRSWTLDRFKMAVQGKTPLLESLVEAGKDFTKKMLGAHRYNNLRSKLLK